MFKDPTSLVDESPAKSGVLGFGIRTRLGIFLAAGVILTYLNWRHFHATLEPALDAYKLRHDSSSFGGMAFVPIATVFGYFAVFAPALIIFGSLGELSAKSHIRIGLIWSVVATAVVAWVALNLGTALLTRPVTLDDFAHSSRSAERKVRQFAKKSCRGHGGVATVSEASKFTILGTGDKMLNITCADNYEIDSNPFKKIEDLASESAR